MRIFYSPGSDPMLLASRARLLELHGALQALLSSASTELELPAEQGGDPAPYEVLLPGLRVRKTTGPIVLGQSPNGWLVLEGSEENLRIYTSHFCFPPDEESGHHHPENCAAQNYLSDTSLNLIIEADPTWGA